MTRIVAFGEGMIEIAGNIGSTGLIGYGGDVLNVTVALARLGLAPSFMTALGVDVWSGELADAWAAEGVDLSLIARHPDRVPGLYGIRTDAEGERTFIYWRGVSAARFFFQLAESEALLKQAAQADVLFLSGITLSLYNAAAQRRIGDLAETIRERGGQVVFDGNYRPNGWPDARAAADAFDAFAPYVSLALPTAGDEQLLHGIGDGETIARRWHQAGAEEVVVKLGAEGAYVSHPGGTHLVTTEALTPVDTTGAGDAFDAGYLAARLAGRAPAAAAAFGHRLAGETIMHRGAIPPRDAVAAIRP
ncbi:sugar kinase [Sphingomonas immobilis]|uniref:Sugar kinase n=1 Tax=Sphingomonas immobilis TaxID=3063997 RepID=A0ABT9A2D4_9SPHN|nr:sugar kinase [Sphingomonas sp. CA1-15]MDO7843514.1 sugar kinase [Sphingomonas sp. CA1-15]